MKRINTDIKNNDFKQLYLIWGTEKYLCRSCRDLLLEALDVKNDQMNFTSFSDKCPTEDEIIKTCETVPFFSEHRVLLLEDTGFFTEKKDKLAAYINDLPAYIVLIFIEDKVDKRGKLYKSASKYERVIECSEMSEEDLSLWIVRKLNEDGKKIRKNNLEYFLSGTGTDMNFISNELEKLMCYCADKEEITADDISSICSFRTENRIFDMISDLTAGRKSKALEKYYDLLQLKEPPMRILYLIARQFSMIHNIKSLLSSTNDQRRIADILKIHPYAVKKTIPLCRKYSEYDLGKILEECAGLEEDVKSGRLPDLLSVELMILNR